MAKIHIGKRIREVVEQSHHSITEFASLINRSRTVAYDIFERDTIDTGLLQQISEVLNHNFFRYYAQDTQSVVKEEKPGYMSQTELLAALSDEIRSMRKQLSELEKKYDSLEKLKKKQGEKALYPKRKRSGK